METIIPDILLYAVREGRCSADYAARICVESGRIHDPRAQKEYLHTTFNMFMSGTSLEECVERLEEYGRILKAPIHLVLLDKPAKLSYNPQTPWQVTIEEEAPDGIDFDSDVRQQRE